MGRPGTHLHQPPVGWGPKGRWFKSSRPDFAMGPTFPRMLGSEHRLRCSRSGLSLARAGGGRKRHHGIWRDLASSARPLLQPRLSSRSGDSAPVRAGGLPCLQCGSGRAGQPSGERGWGGVAASVGESTARQTPMGERRRVQREVAAGNPRPTPLSRALVGARRELGYLRLSPSQPPLRGPSGRFPPRRKGPARPAGGPRDQTFLHGE
jgi:hypothetical protein